MGGITVAERRPARARPWVDNGMPGAGHARELVLEQTLELELELELEQGHVMERETISVWNSPPVQYNS
jgi:hypothetical protein